MSTKACTFLLQLCEQALDSTSVSKYHQHNRHRKCRVPVCRKIQLKRKISNNKWRPNGLCSENGLETNGVWSRVVMNFAMWIMYVSWNLRTSPVISVSRFGSNGNSSFLQFCHALGLKIALILLVRNLGTLNFSSFEQRKGNNIYK